MLFIAVIIKPNIAQAAPPDWDNPGGFQYTMNFVSELQYLDGSISLNENDMVAAFVGDELRGVSSPLAGMGVIFLSVASNTENEPITFKAYLADSDEIVDLNETATFENMGEVGDFADPFTFTIFQGTYYTITASAGTGGSIDPNGAVQVMENGSQSFTIMADAGYNLSDVLVDGSSVGAVSTYSFTDVTADHTIEAVFEIITYTITATAGDNGSIAPVGETTVDYGTDQAYTITADEGYHVLDVLVDGVSVGDVASYTFTNVTADHTIAASFEINSYTIIASAGANGSINPSGDISVTHGSDQSFAITADAGYHVDDVLVDGVSVGDVTTYNFENITEGHTIAASFAINTYTITATAGENGTIDPSGAIELDYGSDQSFTITPNTGYDIADVLVDGVSVGAVAVYNFENVTSDHTIAVSFSIQTFIITATADANGTIDPSGAVSVNYGSNQSFSIAPAEGYHIDDVLVDGTSVGAVSTYVFENVTAVHTIAASFEINTYTLTYIAGENGSLSGTLIQTIDHGSNGTAVEAIPAPTFLFVGWSDGSMENPRTDENVTADLTVTANFAFNTYTISATSGENGDIAPVGEIIIGEGSSQDFTMIPDAGYQVADVLVDGTSVGDVETYEFQNVTADHTIHVDFEIINYEIVATAGLGGTISPSGTINIDHGLNQVFVITPDEGYHIDDVLVDGVSVGAVDSYEFINVTEPHTINASFAINSYTLTYLAGENGSITGEATQNVEHGSDGTAVTAVAATMYHFVDWSDGSIENPRTDLNVTGDLTVTANFAINTYTITATSGDNGSITPEGEVIKDEGTAQEFIITPETGYHIADVLVDGISVGAVSSYEFLAIDADHTIHASFAINTYTITASAGSNGTIDPIGPTVVEYGSDQLFTIFPEENYHIDDVLVDGASIGAVESYTFDNVIEDHTIEAIFAIDTYTLTYLAGENGSLIGETTQIVDHGSDGSAVTAVADEFYHFVDWSDGSTENPRTDYNNMADLSVTANFAIDTYNITSSAGENGTITPLGVTEVEHGADLAFTITPDENYFIDDVLVDGISVGAVATYTFENITEAHTISASFAINTYTITYLADENGSLTGDLTQVVEHGSDGTAVTAVPYDGYLFMSWSDGSTENPRTDLNVTQDITVTASFDVDSYIITASAGENGTITPAGDIIVDYGADQTFTITPDENYFIDDVLVDGISVGAVATYTFENVSEAHTISASFAINTYTITYLADENGSLTGDLTQVVEHGSDGTAVTAVPDVGYSFVTWSDGSTENPRTDLNVTQDITVTASFELNNYIITATTGNNGTIDPIGEVSVSHGSNQLFTMTPDAGYHVADVLVDGNSIGAVATYEFTNVTANRTIHVTYEINTYIITATLSGNGTIDPVGEIVVIEGENLSFSITPAEGHYIADVLVDGTSMGALANYTFTNIDANHTIHASFAVNVYTLTYLAGNNGSISGTAIQYVNHGDDGSAVTAVADDNYHFVQWSDGSTENPRTDLNVTSDLTVTAEFTIDTFTITASASENGTINPSGSITVDYGTTLQFSMNASTGYKIADVIVDGESVGNSSTYTFGNISSDHTIHVEFEIKQYSIIATSAGNGLIDPYGHIILDYGSSQAFTITPAPGHYIDDVIVDGESVGAVSTYEFVNITDYHTIHAIFAINTYTITASAEGNGSITPSGTLNYTYGDSEVFTFTPDAGHHIADVLVDGNSVGIVDQYEFAFIEDDHTIVVLFEINTYTITATAGDHGSIDPSGQIVVDWGEDVVFTFEPDEEFMVDEVFVDGESIGFAESYTFENVVTEHTIHVTFRLIVGLNDLPDWQNYVEVYPNPVVNKTTIEFKKLDVNEANLYYEIYDYAGAVVQRGNLVDKVTQIDVSTLAASRYIIRILDKQTVKATFKLVKIN